MKRREPENFRISQRRFPDTARQEGYLLPVVLFFLFSTLLWGAMFLLALSDRYAMEHETVFREQSRLLAYSGWNMALQQMKTSGSLADVLLDTAAGTARAELEEQAPGRVAVAVQSQAGNCRHALEGTVRLLELPWEEVCAWQITEQPSDLLQPGLLLVSGTAYTLSDAPAQPLAISSDTGEPVAVRIDAPLVLDALYVHGDLLLEAPVQADVIYVSGALSGEEWLDNPDCVQIYAGRAGFRLDVLEREL